MSRVLQRTIQERKARTNVESMIAFDGVNQYASAGVNQNVVNSIELNKSFGISVFLELKSYNNNVFTPFFGQTKSLGGSENYSRGWVVGHVNNSSGVRFFLIFNNQNFRSFQSNSILELNRLYHLFFNYNGISGEIYINGVKQQQATTTQFGTPGFFQESQPLYLSREISLGSVNRYCNILQSHLTVYNRTLTEPEIKGIHRIGGVIPNSAKPVCIAHYPCTERSGKVLNDIVENYNPAKVAAGQPTLTAYNANLINYSDAQVGIPDQSTNTAWRDFYTKQPITSL